MIIAIVLAALVSILWVRGIDRMKDNYPDYKGKDLFNEETENNGNSNT